MTIRILLDHVCPACRAPREGWDLEGVGPAGALRPGAYLPEGVAATTASDRCDACGQRMTGYLALDDEREEGGPGVRLLTVKELERDVPRTVEQGRRLRRRQRDGQASARKGPGK